MEMEMEIEKLYAIGNSSKTVRKQPANDRII